MAHTAFLAACLPLLLNLKGTESSVVEQQPMEIDCTAILYYRTTPINTYAERCAPPNWREFFQREDVRMALNKVNDTLWQKTRREDFEGIEPPMTLVFEALQRITPSQVKVVILGQDPTPQADQATGLAFSVRNPRAVPTVMNVLLELALEGFYVNINQGYLNSWVSQGVVLLNAALTVERKNAGSHVELWRNFTNLLVEYISNNAPASVWFLWGKKAQSFQKKIDSNKHYVILGGHPSPQGSTRVENKFFGGDYFRCANAFLGRRRRGAIKWNLTKENILNECPPEPMEIDMQ